jgi:hypothetical protein
VGAFGGIESAWPVHGSVLVSDGVAYVAAGRSSFLDGGIFACSLDVATGRVLDAKRVASSHEMKVGTGQGRSDDSGLLEDLLVARAGAVYMRQRRLFGDAPGPKAGGRPRLQSTAGFLDESWFNRAHWFVNGRPYGELVVHDGERVFGVRAYRTLNINGGFFKPGTRGYEIFAAASAPKRAGAAGKKKRKRTSGFPPSRWSANIPVRVTSLVLAGDRLFAAGTPDVPGGIETRDPWAAHEGRRGGVLLVLDAADGRGLAERRLDSPPVFDGMAAANGRLYVSTRDGRVVCMKGRP